MITLKVMPDAGAAYVVTATTRDIAKWERTNRGASFAKLQSDMHATDLYVIAYLAASRQGLFTGTQAEFAETCDLDVLDDEDDGPDPTQPAASAGT